ncbi:DUF397 domain-containing protein [Planobispora rosea]|uniref:DUF397 domain-containing protein n=1 Tax=Planobispora rosea TaxID=35762 RepID=UPI000A0487DA|nr:DUF397 domain-containing protein [Planobispora rosea]
MRSAASIEIVWRKSSLSTANNECVEVAVLPDGRVATRDSKDPEGAILLFSAGEWRNFLVVLRTTSSRCSELARSDPYGK